MFVRSVSKNAGFTHLVLPIKSNPQKVQLHRVTLLPSKITSFLNQPSALTSKLSYPGCKNIISWRMLASSSANSSELPKQPQDTSKKPPNKENVNPPQRDAILEQQLQRISQLHSQLTRKDQQESSIATVPERGLNLGSKKVGWLVSGTAIGLMAAILGKSYMLFGAVPLFLYHAKDMDIMSKTFSRDSTFLWRYSKCWFLAKRIKNENLTLPKVFQQMEKRHPDKIMLQMHDQNWKYKDIASYANRTSRLMQKYGLRKGDVVAIFALNSPEMVAIVLGMANLGIITTLISTELRNKGLTQAMKNSGCKAIIFDDELMHAFGDVFKNFQNVRIFQMRHKAKQPHFHVLEEELLKEYNDQPEVFVSVHYDDPLMYMYSPEDDVYQEPIVITHEKFIFDSTATAMMLNLNDSEKIYNPTPLHETTGMILGIGPSITNGVTTVLRSRFSASDYFRECYIYSCTIGQYTGNMCKHLLLSPVSPIETFHPVRAMYGNGLESDYWQEFVNRFGTKMFEVHNISKDSINLINLEGKVGVVGFRPKIAPGFLFPHYVIKVFGKDNIPVRTENGLCQMCDYGEPGMLIKLWTGSSNLPQNIKIIKNIFKLGDMAITNEEILTIDENLYLRPLKKHLDKSWMNKLVTSEEVEYIASKFTSKRCAAYSLPMAYKQDLEILAIEDPKRTLDMKKFTEDLVDHLPRNWVPHYVRIVSTFERLENNKVDKQRLIEQGLHMEGDLVHYFDKKSMCYLPLIWGKRNRPQMIVNESKIQPLAEKNVQVQKAASRMKEARSDDAESVSKESVKKVNNAKIVDNTSKITETNKDVNVNKMKDSHQKESVNKTIENVNQLKESGKDLNIPKTNNINVTNDLKGINVTKMTENAKPKMADEPTSSTPPLKTVISVTVRCPPLRTLANSGGQAPDKTKAHITAPRVTEKKATSKYEKLDSEDKILKIIDNPLKTQPSPSTPYIVKTNIKKIIKEKDAETSVKNPSVKPSKVNPIEKEMNELVMTKLLKNRLAEQSKEAKAKASNIPSSDPDSVENRTAMLIRNVLQIKPDEVGKPGSKPDTDGSPKVQPADVKTADKNVSDANLGFGTTQTSTTPGKSEILTGTTASESGQDPGKSDHPKKP